MTKGNRRNIQEAISREYSVEEKRDYQCEERKKKIGKRSISRTKKNNKGKKWVHNSTPRNVGRK